jgi:hypothetical protein
VIVVGLRSLALPRRYWSSNHLGLERLLRSGRFPR